MEILRFRAAASRRMHCLRTLETRQSFGVVHVARSRHQLKPSNECHPKNCQRALLLRHVASRELAGSDNGRSCVSTATRQTVPRGNVQADAPIDVRPRLGCGYNTDRERRMQPGCSRGAPSSPSADRSSRGSLGQWNDRLRRISIRSTRHRELISAALMSGASVSGSTSRRRKSDLPTRFGERSVTAGMDRQVAPGGGTWRPPAESDSSV